MAEKETRKSSKKKERMRGGQKEVEDDNPIPWKDVTPRDPIALLSGSNEGGFMCLEEVDGELYSQYAVEPLIEGNQAIVPSLEGLAKRKNAKKRKRALKKETKEVSGLEGLLPDKERTKAKKRRKEEGLKCETETHEAEKHATAEAGDALFEDKALENSFPSTQDDSFKGEDEEVQHDKLSAWRELRLHQRIMKALSILNFTEPTSIQKACIPAAAHQGKDVIGAAETGSGKTLAYVIPILQRLLDEEEKYLHTVDRQGEIDELPLLNNRYRGFLRALILTPTRELSLQVSNDSKFIL
ncbi:hypothetical protein GOP47_0030971 [Adiantum capillus-veneris]|nr:hypothetical protein GOP47_0030971 [Adiantum capillus-veneris]